MQSHEQGSSPGYEQEEIVRLRSELISMTKLCEDIINERKSKFSKSNEDVLEEKISYFQNSLYTSYIKLLLENVRSKFYKQIIDESFIHVFAAAIEEIRFVDSAWYLEINKDVAEAGHSAGYHYIMWGQDENRSPNRNVAVGVI